MLRPQPRVSVAAEQISKPSFRDRLMAISELNSLLRIKISIPLLNGEAVNEDFVKIYGLSAGEVAQLKASFSAARKRIAELEAQHASIEPKGENAYAISISAFPKEGGMVYDGLLQSLHDVLGDERFAAYRVTGNDLDSSIFGGFGLSETVIDLQPLKEGETPTSNSSTNFDSAGLMKVRVKTNPYYFPKQYPEIYQKMIISGLWKRITHD